MLIPSDRPALAAVKLSLPARSEDAPPARFDVVQMAGERVMGGCTFEVRS
jgi:hypothetical protein